MQLNYKAPNAAKTISPPKHNWIYLVHITESTEASLTGGEDQDMLLHHHCLTLGQAALWKDYEALWNKIWSAWCSYGSSDTYRITGL